MKVRATLATRAISIVMVNDSTNRGEKVFNAYILSSIRFELLVIGDLLARLGCSLSALLLSIVTNGASPHRVMAALYAHKTKVSSFFFKFFFVGCGASGVEPRVWSLGCGASGVEPRVWGCGAAGYGWGGLDSSSGCGGRIEPPGLPQSGFGLGARV